MKQIEVSVRNRDGLGKGVSRASRREGWIPAEVYGAGKPNDHVLIGEREFRAAVRAGALKSLVTLKYAQSGETSLAIIREAQTDPLGDKIQHVDFYRVTPSKPIQFSLAVVTKGRAKGEAAGGILEHLTRELKVEGLPSAIPDEIVVDVTPLELGHTLHVQDITHYEGVKFLAPPETPVVAVKALRGTKAVEAAATAEGEAVAKADADDKGAAKPAAPKAKKG